MVRFTWDKMKKEWDPGDDRIIISMDANAVWDFEVPV